MTQTEDLIYKWAEKAMEGGRRSDFLFAMASLVKEYRDLLKTRLTDDKICTESFNYFTGDSMEREGFENGAKWVRDQVLRPDPNSAKYL